MGLERRHGTMVHANKAYLFWTLVFGALFLYSLVLLIRGALNPRRKFQYRVPPWTLILFWSLACVFGLFIHPSHEFVGYIRRMGRLSIACAVLGIFLSFKPAVLPRTYSVPLTQIHKWVGRTAVLFAFLHGLLYSCVYLKRGVFGRLFRPANLAGIFACFTFCVIALTSLKPIRRRTYSVFYAIHVVSVWMALLAIFYHADPNAYAMVYLAMVLLIIQITVRVLLTRTVPVKVKHISSNLDLVTVDRSALPETFEIGSHLRLSLPLHLPKSWLVPSHPYTIASLPEDDAIHLVVRRTRFELQNQEYAIQGPHHAPFDVSEFKRIIVVAGGSGFALIPPVSRRAKQLGIDVKSVWIVKTDAETSVLNHIPVDDCEIFITTESNYNTEETAAGTYGDEFELDDLRASDREGLLDSSNPSKPKEGIKKYFQGRPNLDEFIGDFFDPSQAAETCVAACGPESLTKDARRWAKAHNCGFFAETFAM